MIKSIHLKNFTVFDDLKMDLSPKINIIIGENSTGKTHILKALYVMSSDYESGAHDDGISKFDARYWLSSRMSQVFKPLDGKIGALKKHKSEGKAYIGILYPDDSVLNAEFSDKSELLDFPQKKDLDVAIQKNKEASPIFIPAKEVLSMMLGLRSILQRYRTSFDASYDDLMMLLELPDANYDMLSQKVKNSMEMIENTIKGKFVFLGGGSIIFKSHNDDLSINVMAEGYRKLGTLYRLLETGVLNPASSAPLIWDEPDANLNPVLISLLVNILVELSKEGQQVIIATHNYYLVKWFDLLIDKEEGDHALYHLLYRDGNDKVCLQSSENYLELEPNPINETFNKLYDVELQRGF